MKNFKFEPRDVIGVLMLIIVFVWFFALLWIEIPEGNQKIVDIASGIIIGSGFVAVINFYFGSSKGSADKSKAMEEAVKIREAKEGK